MRDGPTITFINAHLIPIFALSAFVFLALYTACPWCNGSSSPRGWSSGCLDRAALPALVSVVAAATVATAASAVTVGDGSLGCGRDGASRPRPAAAAAAPSPPTAAAVMATRRRGPSQQGGGHPPSAARLHRRGAAAAVAAGGDGARRLAARDTAARAGIGRRQRGGSAPRAARPPRRGAVALANGGIGRSSGVGGDNSGGRWARAAWAGATADGPATVVRGAPGRGGHPHA